MHLQFETATESWDHEFVVTAAQSGRVASYLPLVTSDVPNVSRQNADPNAAPVLHWRGLFSLSGYALVPCERVQRVGWRPFDRLLNFR